jgi:predicted acyl esterase
MAESVKYMFTKPVSDPFARKAKHQSYSRKVENGMVIEIHVPIPLRNGFHAFGDIYRPVDELTKAPTLLSWTVRWTMAQVFFTKCLEC